MGRLQKGMWVKGQQMLAEVDAGAGLWAWSLAGQTSPRFLKTSPVPASRVPAAPTQPGLRPLALEGQQAELGG